VKLRLLVIALSALGVTAVLTGPAAADGPLPDLPIVQMPMW
jgi:hypothetical protein